MRSQRGRTCCQDTPKQLQLLCYPLSLQCQLPPLKSPPLYSTMVMKIRDNPLLIHVHSQNSIRLTAHKVFYWLPDKYSDMKCRHGLSLDHNIIRTQRRLQMLFPRALGREQDSFTDLSLAFLCVDCNDMIGCLRIHLQERLLQYTRRHESG